MALRVTKISQVSPATTSDSVDSLVLPLTLFDLQWLIFPHTQQVIFYKLSESSIQSFYSVILPRLEKSLSLVLRHYLPFAGHLTWDPKDPKPCIVVLPEDTVSLTVAETDADFSSVSSKGLRPAREIRPLVPELPVFGGSPALLSLQVTLFPNQGYSIGIASNHVLVDVKTAHMLLKSWAYICKHGGSMALPEDLTPSLDRPVFGMELEAKMLGFHGYFPEDKDSARTLKVPPIQDVDADVFRLTLKLKIENIEKLKERAKNESIHELHLSTFVVVSAYLWSCLVKACGGDVERPVTFIYTVDFRNRLEPPLPETYLGTCVFPVCCLDYKAKQFMGEDGFVKAVEILSNSVKGLVTQQIEELFVLVDRMKNTERGTQICTVSGSNRVQFYGLDFGWGRPVSSENVSIDQSQTFSMLGTSDAKGGVEIGLCLKNSEMDVFISLFENGFKD